MSIDPRITDRTPKGTPLLARVQSKSATRLDTGCFEWHGSLNQSGYGSITLSANGQRLTRRVHRVMYELLRGPIPEGLQLDHLCRNRRCWNPDHLEPVTCRENLHRGVTNATKTHCLRGHEFTPENTATDRWYRRCRACHREHGRMNREKARGSAAKAV